ncbi:MAG: hypothetical protein K1X88_21975, partial [Nannocystaceae bacterium]|nr:hypothetical protein [Nannocystaceae bacterium]
MSAAWPELGLRARGLKVDENSTMDDTERGARGHFHSRVSIVRESPTAGNRIGVMPDGVRGTNPRGHAEPGSPRQSASAPDSTLTRGAGGKRGIDVARVFQWLVCAAVVCAPALAHAGAGVASMPPVQRPRAMMVAPVTPTTATAAPATAPTETVAAAPAPAE